MSQSSDRHHPDPLLDGVVDRSIWTARRKEAFASREMEAFREGLLLPGLPDIRSSVLDDLSVYFGVDAERCLYIIRHSFELGSEEWLAKERDSADAILDFYSHAYAYNFGTLWYMYLQAEGWAYPVSAVIARDMVGLPVGRHLDFGSGVGVTGQMFHLLGYDVTLADISQPMLDFARFRMERRGYKTGYVDLTRESLGVSAFDTVTAIHVLAHVPDVHATGSVLHSAIAPEGTLYADIDASPRRHGDDRLYDDDLPVKRDFLRSGFVVQKKLECSVRYRRAETGTPSAMLRVVGDSVMYGPARRVWRSLRAAVQRF